MTVQPPDPTPTTSAERACAMDECVPLCAADKAYGRNAPWWKHEALCPARKARRPDPEVPDA